MKPYSPAFLPYWRYAEANIHINLPAWKGMSNEDVERAIVHELMHIRQRNAWRRIAPRRTGCYLPDKSSALGGSVCAVKMHAEAFAFLRTVIGAQANDSPGCLCWTFGADARERKSAQPVP